MDVTKATRMPARHSYDNGLSSTRSLNIRAIVRTIGEARSISRQQIAQITKLSIPTVWRLIDELLTAGIVREAAAGMLPKKRGPKTLFVEINPKTGWVAGIEISSERIRAAAMDMAGGTLGMVENELMNLQGNESVSLIITQTLKDLIQAYVPSLGKPL